MVVSEDFGDFLCCRFTSARVVVALCRFLFSLRRSHSFCGPWHLHYVELFCFHLDTLCIQLVCLAGFRVPFLGPSGGTHLCDLRDLRDIVVLFEW